MCKKMRKVMRELTTMRKMMRKVMRTIASMCKMMRKIAVMRKMMRKTMCKIIFMRMIMRKMKISSSNGEYSRQEQRKTFKCHLFIVCRIKTLFSELGLTGFGETKPNANLGPFPVSIDEHSFSY